MKVKSQISTIEQARQLGMIICSGNIDAFRQAAEAGVELYCVDPDEQNISYKVHALIYATSYRRVEIVKYLVEELKVDVTTINDHGHTAMYIAIAGEHLRPLKCLVNHDDVNAIPKGFWQQITPLQYAVARRKEACVKILIENGAHCDQVFATPPDYRSLDYIQFGSFVQSLYSDSKAIHGTDEAITEILSLSVNWNFWTKFAIESMQNFILKNELFENCLTKIKTCSVLPDEFRNNLLEAISSIAETFESLDSELLYLNNLIESPLSHGAASNPTLSAQSDSNELQNITNTYELFANHKQKGFCTIHFASTPLNENLSLLAGFMLLYPQVKDSVELLLGHSLPHETYRLLTKSLKQCNDSKLTVSNINDMLIEFQLSSPNLFYPINKQQIANDKNAAEEKATNYLNFSFDSTLTSNTDDIKTMGSDKSDPDLHGD